MRFYKQKSFSFIVTDLNHHSFLQFFFFWLFTFYRVPETLSDQILEKMHATKKPDFPFANPKTLTEYDAFLFGIPTRFGNMPAQIKVWCCFFFFCNFVSKINAFVRASFDEIDILGCYY